MMHRLAWLLMFAILCGATTVSPLGVGGTSVQAKDQTTSPPALLRFQSAEDMRAYLAAQAYTPPPNYYYAPPATTGTGGFGCASPIANLLGGNIYSLTPLTTDPTMTADSSQDGGSGSNDVFSTTNIQEAGVDEADVVKSNGTYFYLATGKSVYVVQAMPADGLSELARLDLPYRPGSLYLHGNTVIALTENAGSGYWYNSGQKSSVSFIDISNPSAPTVAATLEFDGGLASSRLIGNKLYLVLTTGRPVSLGSNQEPLQTIPLERWLPNYNLTAADGATQSGDVVGWEDSYRPSDSMGYGLTAVITVDVENPTGQFGKAAITGSAQTIYASTSALYVTSASYAGGTNSTVVHKFDLTGDAASYVGSGSVPGSLLNQYSMGEYKGHLRLATSLGWKGPNAVYVIAPGQTAGVLDIVGKIENIAPNEKLHSARFIGDRGFMVTFKKVDPLFTLDLSDPTNPRLVGELKVPGYSEYIHLMDENHLLTIGKDTYDMGDFAWYQGVQLSIFDVTDFADPTLMHKEVIGVRGTDSEALLNPKAFSYFAAKNALAVPITLAEGPTAKPESYGQFTFAGLYVYNVTLDGGFQLLGRISTDTPNNAYYWYNTDYTRGLFVGDYVFAATGDLVSAATLAPPLTVVKTVTLSETPSEQ